MSVGADGCGEVVTWHHGLIARWWANFNLDGPEIDFFRPFVEAGQPALDAACGTGRLLVPWVASGLEVDGVDASADMVAECRAAARRVGCSPGVYVQPLHELDLPRRYATVVVCGGFALGTTRQQDLDGLRRLFAHLRPGGVLTLDYYHEQFDPDHWSAWQPQPVDESPPRPENRRVGTDGYEYALRDRVTAVDVDTRQVTKEIQVWQWSHGELIALETHRLTENSYTSSEIVSVLSTAGFDNLHTVDSYHYDQSADSARATVYVAYRPTTTRRDP